METIQLAIEGMSCGHCVARVTKTLTALPGSTVENVDIGSARIAAADATVAAAAIAALHEAGYEARAVPSEHAAR